MYTGETVEEHNLLYFKRWSSYTKGLKAVNLLGLFVVLANGIRLCGSCYTTILIGAVLISIGLVRMDATL